MIFFHCFSNAAVFYLVFVIKMRFYAFLLFLVVATILSMASADDSNDDDCTKCASYPYKPMCGVNNGEIVTYNCECDMNCNDANLMHEGECTNDDLLKIDSPDDSN